MKLLLKLEELAQFVLAFVLYIHTGDVWWHFFAWLLVPDIGMIGYAVNSKVGAVTYNLTHHKAIAIAMILGGWWLDANLLLLAGIIMFGHSGMDRVFGYGLKHTDSFSNTHLGRIGKTKPRIFA